jgi:hypothetical protein
MKTIRMTLTVTYQSNGVPDDELAAHLQFIGEYAADNGMMSGNTDATVDDWRVDVETLD